MRRLARAQAAHHGAAVEVTLEVTPCGKRNGRRRQQHTGERGQIEEALGTLEHGAYLRPRIAYALYALSRCEPGACPVAVGLHRRRFARDLQAVTNAASRLDQARCCQVRGVQHEARRAAQEPDGHSRLVRDDGSHPQAGIAHAHAIAAAQLESGVEPFVHPYGPRFGDRCGAPVRAEQTFGDAQFPPQRKSLCYDLDVRQHISLALDHHARKPRDLDDREPPARRFVFELRRDRTAVGNDEIRPEQPVCLLGERPLDTVGEKPHRRHGRHRDHDRHSDQRELPGAVIALEQPPRERDLLPDTWPIAP